MIVTLDSDTKRRLEDLVRPKSNHDQREAFSTALYRRTRRVRVEPVRNGTEALRAIMQVMMREAPGASVEVNDAKRETETWKSREGRCFVCMTDGDCLCAPVCSSAVHRECAVMLILVAARCACGRSFARP